MKSWIKGMDLSSLLEVEECGGRFRDKGVSGDAMEILHSYGMNLIRLRLWNNPYTPDGEPYGAGTNDLARTMLLARRAQKLGVGWMLDFFAAILWCSFFRCNFGLCTVMLAAVYYLLYDQKSLRVLIGCAVSAMYITAPISGYALWNYTGERGRNKHKYVFYILYPLHLLILGVIAHIMAG